MGKSENHKKNIRNIVMALCKQAHSVPQDINSWPKTRAVANACDISVYSARVWLLVLANEGKVICSNRIVCNSLRWYCYPSEEGNVSDDLGKVQTEIKP